MANLPRVSISPENIEILKEKYGLDEAGLKELLGHVEVTAPIEARVQPATLPKPDGDLTGENELIKQLSRGDLTMAEVVMYEGMQIRRDREARRERMKEERQNNGDQMLTASDIGKEVGGQVYGMLKEVGLLGNGAKTPEEIPEWAKAIEKHNAEILNKFKDDEEKKERLSQNKELIAPLVNRLDKHGEKLESLARPAPEGMAAPKSELTTFLDMRKLLKEEGIIGNKSNIMLGPGGNPIPIKGEIPALAVYGPYLADQILGSIEKMADNIGKKYGLIGEEQPAGLPKKAGEPLIRMPPKPEPAAKPIEPVVEAATEKVKTTEPEKAVEKIIDMPKKPTKEEAVTEEPVEESVKPTVLRLCAECRVKKELLSNGICKSCVTKLAEHHAPSVSVADTQPLDIEALTVDEPEEGDITFRVNKKITEIAGPNAPTITYVCKYCGADGFEKPWQLAAHTRKCPEAIAAKKRKKADEHTTNNSD